MKNVRLVLFVAMAILSPSVSWGDLDMDIGLCKGFSEYAFSAMRARQEGVAMKIPPKPTDEYEEQGWRIISKIIVQAYEQPRYQTKSMKLKAAQDLRDSAYLECYKRIPEYNK